MLKTISGLITCGLFRIPPESTLGRTVDFFFYETMKIFLLLTAVIFVISIVRTYVPPEKIKKFLAGKTRFRASVFSALFGILTPFCSCSAVPLFIGFVRAGVPLEATFSFLVASPMINEIALVMLFGLFGWKIALIYVSSGLVIAVVSGMTVGKLNIRSLINDFVFDEKYDQSRYDFKFTFSDRLAIASGYTLAILKKAWLYVLIGIAAGAGIHGYVPADFIAEYASADKWYAVPLAAGLGIPLYANAAGIIPMVSALTGKGVAMGTALAFMMAVTALSLPEFVILKTVMKKRLIILFAAVVGSGIIFTGYFFNFVLR